MTVETTDDTEREKGWPAATRRTFLDALAAGGSVAAAAKEAGTSESGAYRERRRSAAFRDAWEKALAERYAMLELKMLERALDGVEKPVFQTGKEVGRVREYSDRLALSLLAYHREGGGRAAAPKPDGSARQKLRAKLEQMARRMAGEE
jgi:hypothetical protein